MALFFKIMLAVALAGVTLIPCCKADQLQLGNKQRRAGHLKNQAIVIADEAKKPKGVHLRVCNAFSNSVPLDLVHKPGHHHTDSVKTGHLTSKTGLLAYKDCKEWSVDLRRGDSLEFLQDSSHLGSFSVSAVPQFDTLLLLVIHHRNSSPRPAFASHVFAKAKSAQVAVLDMYRGPSKGRLAIEEVKDEDESQRKVSVLSEDLAYDSVVALNPEKYICKLVGGVKPQQVALSAKTGESYVAMRVGEGKDEEIVVYPTSGVNGHSILASSLILMVTVIFGF